MRKNYGDVLNEPQENEIIGGWFETSLMLCDHRTLRFDNLVGCCQHKE